MPLNSRALISADLDSFLFFFLFLRSLARFRLPCAHVLLLLLTARWRFSPAVWLSLSLSRSSVELEVAVAADAGGDDAYAAATAAQARWLTWTSGTFTSNSVAVRCRPLISRNKDKYFFSVLCCDIKHKQIVRKPMKIIESKSIKSWSIASKLSQRVWPFVFSFIFIYFFLIEWLHKPRIERDLNLNTIFFSGEWYMVSLMQSTIIVTMHNPIKELLWILQLCPLALPRATLRLPRPAKIFPAAAITSRALSYSLQKLRCALLVRS